MVVVVVVVVVVLLESVVAGAAPPPPPPPPPPQETLTAVKTTLMNKVKIHPYFFINTTPLYDFSCYIKKAFSAVFKHNQKGFCVRIVIVY